VSKRIITIASILLFIISIIIGIGIGISIASKTKLAVAEHLNATAGLQRNSELSGLAVRGGGLLLKHSKELTAAKHQVLQLDVQNL
jgi:hypothetical protein